MEIIKESTKTLQVEKEILDVEHEKFLEIVNSKKRDLDAFKNKVGEIESEVESLQQHKLKSIQLKELLIEESERMDEKNEVLEKLVVKKMQDMDVIKDKLK